METDTRTQHIGKVTAYVVLTGSRPKLLVFRHPFAGIQLPAGTIERGETAAAAARREVLEETGVAVDDEAIVLEERVTRLAKDEAILLESVVSRVSPSIPGGPCFQRGHKVTVLDQKDRILHVAEYEFDYSASPPKISRSVSGWIPVDMLGKEIKRSFVLLYPRVSTVVDRWTRNADGYDVDVFWAPLDAPPELVEGQGDWLNPLFNYLHMQKLVQGR